MSDWHRVCAAADLRIGGLRAATVGGRAVVVCRTASGVHALDDLCTHADAKMSDGRVKGDRIVCPMHGAAFDCATGAVLSGPACVPLRAHETRVEGGYVEVKLRG